MAIRKISPLFAQERIKFFHNGSKDEIIEKMALLSKDKVNDVDSFIHTVKEREAIVSTGIGQGFAIPHVKNEYVPEFFIAVGIVKNGVEWDAIDNNPVHIVFLIGGPEESQNEYLSILSKLSLIIKNPKHKDFLLHAESPEEIYNFFKKF